MPWVLRLAWVAVLVLGDPAIAGATVERSDLVQAVAEYGAGITWLLGVCAMAIPAVISLTATRALVPLSIPAAILALVFGADPAGWAFTGIAALTTVVAFSGELGRPFVQASAYGEEDRHLLRPPSGYAVASGLAWLLWAAAILGGSLLLATKQWIVGGLLAQIALGGTALLWPRWHRLSQRWLVIVPAGLVIHDQLVLAETVMLRRSEIAALHLAPADTTAADLTGPASGHAIEIVTHESVTAILAASAQEPGGKAIHLTACLVSPSRPGHALHGAVKRRLPVG
jgi:hypothetical protein